MKLKSVWICLFLGASLACSSVGLSGKYKLRKYSHEKLKNGLNIIYVKDSQLPYFTMQMLVSSGSTNDPQTKSGLSYMVANLLEKGTQSRSANELADSLGQIGSSFNASVDDDYSFFAVSTLSFNRERLLKDFVEILTKPAFSLSEIRRLKAQVKSEIKSAVDDPSNFASMAYTSYIYGAHPYGRRTMGTIRDVSSIRKKNINRFYLQNYRPNNAYLAVVGAVDNNIKDEIRKAFSSWKSSDVKTPDYPIVPAIKGINIKLVNKSDLAQTQIRIGHKAIKRTNPDFLKLRLASLVLGGAFSSRLMQRVRIEKGLTYSIGARFGAQKDYGSFTVSTFTRHDKVGETIKETLKVLDNFKKSGVTEKELESAKALAKGLFPRALETAEKFSQNLLMLRFYGIGDEYLTDYYKNIDAISQSDVNKAIAKYLDPQDLKILVFAPKSKTVKQLRPIGLLQVEDFKRFSK